MDRFFTLLWSFLKFPFFFFSFFFFNPTHAEILEVNAESFVSTGTDGKSILEGNVDVKKGEDQFKADRVEIYTDKQRKPEKILAFGNVRFSFTTEDGRRLSGHSNELSYDARSNDYHLIGNAHVQEKDKGNLLDGDEIFFNNKTGQISVKGNHSKPAKLIFNLEEK